MTIKKYFLFTLSFIIIGCTSTKNVILKDVSNSPNHRQTYLTKQLACIGDMVAEYRQSNEKITPLKIAIISGKDSTGISETSDREIPKDFTPMLLNIASSIGGAIRVSHIPTSDEIINAANAATASQFRWSHNLKLGSAKGIESNDYFGNFIYKHYQPGTYLIYANITEYDRVFRNTKNSFDGSSGFGGGKDETVLPFSYSDSKTIARITMDFRVIDTDYNDIINNASISESIILHQNSSDFSFGISLHDQSIGFGRFKEEVDARHAALRVLSELGLIEIIGRISKTPYWKCLSTPTNNYDLRIVSVTDDLEQKEEIEKFYNEFKIKEEQKAAIAVGIEKDDTTEWIFAGFNKNKEFIEKKANYKLRNELQKYNIDNSINKNNIINMIISNLEQTKNKSPAYKKIQNENIYSILKNPNINCNDLVSCAKRDAINIAKQDFLVGFYNKATDRLNYKFSPQIQLSRQRINNKQTLFTFSAYEKIKEKNSEESRVKWLIKPIPVIVKGEKVAINKYIEKYCKHLKKNKIISSKSSCIIIRPPITLSGKQQKLKRIISLYSRYNNQDKTEIIDDLKNRELLKNSKDYLSLYLSMWANSKIKEGARWTH